MDFKEVRSLERYFGKYLTYDGYSLWKFIDVALYYKFLEGEKGPSFVDGLFARPVQSLVKFRRFQRKGSLNGLKKEKRDVLFFPFAATHVHTFNNLIKNLDSCKVIIKDGLMSDEVKTSAKSLDIPFVNVERYFDKDIGSDVKNSLRWVNSAWKAILNDAEIRALFEEKPFIKSSLKYFLFYRKRIIEIIEYIKLIEKIYSIEKPKLVVVSDENTDFGSLVVTIANKKGIPSLNVQHGMIMFNKVVTSELKATITAVFGPNDKNYLVENGLDAEKIVVTGQPRYDGLINSKLDRLNECKKLGLDPKKKICLFATQYAVNKKDRVIVDHVRQTIIETFKNRKDLQLIIKTHPSDNRNYRSEISSNISVVDDIQLNWKLYNLCDLVMVTSSTVALEALICGKPLIIVNMGNDIHYLKEGVALGATDKKELERAINLIFNDPKTLQNLARKRKTFIHNYSYKADGRSTERVLRLIKGFL